MVLVRGHGLGNDYLVLADGPTLSADAVRQLCDRHTGVGSDGLLEPTPGGDCDYGVRIWNPDGSIAEKSGNGLRIFARWLRDGGAPAQFTIWTGHDAVRCDVSDTTITIDMGTANFHSPGEELVGGVQGTVLDVGNPHFVSFSDVPDWHATGAMLEVHERFADRTNVQFAQIIDRQTVHIRIWERGAGVTSASGSSSCAAAAAGVRTGRLDFGRITVTMAGGELFVTVFENMAVALEGPVEMVGTITVDPRWLTGHLES